MRAADGLDPSGALAPLPEERRDASLGLFAEYGLTDELTVQVKADWQDGQDAFVDYEERGPVELGLTWQVHRDEANAISLYAGYAWGGEGTPAMRRPAQASTTGRIAPPSAAPWRVRKTARGPIRSSPSCRPVPRRAAGRDPH